ncbi:hypothetical protein LUZ60_005541 [Juncus effusus]|nr:hypothetical protein LUZ60_005541 [Juncus effusus]
MNQPMDCESSHKNASSSTVLSLEGKESEQEKKRGAVDAEMARVSGLPVNSSYAIHRIKVLKKLLHLMSIERRSMSQDEELELLFASLSI